MKKGELYFAFGTNGPEQMDARGAMWNQMGSAILQNHTLAFDKVSMTASPGHSVANVHPQEDSMVVGRWYDLDPDAQAALDEFEVGTSGFGYNKVTRTVQTEDGPRSATLYVARHELVVPGLHPTEEYLGRVLENVEKPGGRSYAEKIRRAAGL